jgi:hypothetical protein
MHRVAFEPIPLLMPGKDQDGRLAFIDERLAAVLVRLDDDIHEDKGFWHLELAVGAFAWRPHPAPFKTLDDAAAWLRHVACTLPGTEPDNAGSAREVGSAPR